MKEGKKETNEERIPEIQEMGLIVFLAFSVLFSATYGEDVSQLQAHPCSKTPFADLCNRTLTIAGGEKKSDIKVLAVVALSATAASGAATSRYIADHLNGKINDPVVLQCFSDCSDAYLDAVEQIEDSSASLDSSDLDGAKAMVYVAVADVDTCRGGCKGAVGGEAAALLQKNELVGKLCANALAIINLVPSA